MLLVLVAAAAGGAVAAVAVEATGRGAFPTHPVSALALAGGAVAVWLATGGAPVRSRVGLRALAVGLLAYLWLGVGACAVDDPVLAAAWSAGWMPVNGLVVVVGLTAAGMPRAAVALSTVTALATVGTAAVAEPTRPFDGLPTVAPEVWASRVPWLADGLVLLLAGGMLAAFVAVVVRAARAHVTERRHLVCCAATTSMGVGLVVMCVALAALRDPGEVDPTSGSVGYVVAVALTSVLAAYGSMPSRWPLRTVLGYWAGAVAVLVGVQASLVRPPALAVALTVAVAGAAAVGAVVTAGRLERWLEVPRPRLVTGVPRLTPRENEVLAAVAAGGTNAGIAAELYLSERTVEQHLRSIFHKLDLGDHDSSNRRVRAAAIWWQHQAAEERVDDAPA